MYNNNHWPKHMIRKCRIFKCCTLDCHEFPVSAEENSEEICERRIQTLDDKHLS